ncbi:MAG: isoamylase early set domain-containing protein [Anaerolineae bacterium]
MIQKTFVKAGERPVVRVVFILPSSIWADTIYLVGDFNSWNRRSHPFRRDRDGRWILDVELELGRAYQFRYLCDGVAWMTDMQADAYVSNPSGNDNFVVVTDPNFEPHYD